MLVSLAGAVRKHLARWTTEKWTVSVRSNEASKQDFHEVQGSGVSTCVKKSREMQTFTSKPTRIVDS